MIILALIVGIIFGVCILFPQVKKTIAKNDEIAKFNREQETKKIMLTESIKALQGQKQVIEDAIAGLNKNHESLLEIVDINFETQLILKGKEVQKALTEYDEEYLSLIEERAKALSQSYEELQNLKAEIEDYQKIVQSAVDANKRAEEEENKKMFYRLQLSDKDLEEVKSLRQIIPLLRDAEPLNKVIWKVYYENPTSDLIGRVIGSGNHTGIYKITNTLNGKCYVGQASDLGSRWKQHIKRGLGAEPITNNKLYPAMWTGTVI